jgi:flagellin
MDVQISKIKEEIIMVINHNLSAMNAHRQMGINTDAQAKATEKLSSGQKINRAGDDAAGLAISEK